MLNGKRMNNILVCYLSNFRSNHSDALEVYFHIFQSFSTTEPGIEALGSTFTLFGFILYIGIMEPRGSDWRARGPGFDTGSDHLLSFLLVLIMLVNH